MRGIRACHHDFAVGFLRNFASSENTIIYPALFIEPFVDKVWLPHRTRFLRFFFVRNYIVPLWIFLLNLTTIHKQFSLNKCSLITTKSSEYSIKRDRWLLLLYLHETLYPYIPLIRYLCGFFLLGIH